MASGPPALRVPYGTELQEVLLGMVRRDLIRTAPGLPEANFDQLRGHGFSFQSRVEVSLGFRRRDVSDGLEKTAVVEPVHPFQCGILDALEAAPRAAPVDDLRLKKPLSISVNAFRASG